MSTIEKAGLYLAIEENEYHADPTESGSLSSTEAKRVLDSPATYRWIRDHGQESNPAFDLGHVVHGIVLGEGLDVAVYPADVLSSSGAPTTKAAREFAAQARSEGRALVKQADYDKAVAMADAVLTHPAAGPLFVQGDPEVSAFAPDPETGVWMRGRFDWLSENMIVDLKTTADPRPSAFARSVVNYGYDLQREWYRTLHRLTQGGEAPDFLHVVVGKEAPYLVGVYRFDPLFEEIGKAKVRTALDTYAQCVKWDQWPGLPEQVTTLDAPSWYVKHEIGE